MPGLRASSRAAAISTSMTPSPPPTARTPRPRALTHLLPSYAGPLMLEEIDALRTVLDKPRRPTAALVGGAKVSTKIPILKHLLEKVDKLIIGGGMANTFLLSHGVDIGKSLAEPDLVGDGARDHVGGQAPAAAPSCCRRTP